MDVSGGQANVLLRPGGVPLEAIRQIVPEIEVVERFANLGDEAMSAPGMLLKHYSPRAELRLFNGSEDFYYKLHCFKRQANC